MTVAPRTESNSSRRFVVLPAALLAVILACTGGERALAPPVPVAGLGPQSLAVGEGSLWLAVRSDDIVYRVDRRTLRFRRPGIRVGDNPYAAVFSGGDLWVANYAGRSVSRIDGRRGRTVGRPIRVGGGPSGLAVGAGRVWVVNYADRTVVAIDPRRGRLVGRPIPVGAGASAIAYGDGRVWVAASFSGEVGEIDPRRGRVVRTIRLPGPPRTLAYGAGALWVTSGTESELFRVDPRTGRMAGQPIRIGDDPGGIVVRGTRLSVASGGGGVTRVDGLTGRAAFVRTPRVEEPAAIAAGFGSIYIASFTTGRVGRVAP